MKTIDVNEWNLFSERPYSRSYINQSGELMLKAVDKTDQTSVDYLVEEYKVATIANKLEIPTAKVYDLVDTTRGEIGIIYQYLRDKISFSRAISKEPDRLEEYVKGFTAVVKKLHSIEADTSLVPSHLDRIYSGLEATNIFTATEKEVLKERIAALPEDTKCLHGDMTLSNAVHSPSGDFVIDLGLLSYGNPLFDVAYFYNLVQFLPESWTKQFLHIDQATLKRCWEIYACEYFGSNDLKEIEAFLLPYVKYAGLTVLSVEPDAESIVASKDFILSE